MRAAILALRDLRDSGATIEVAAGLGTVNGDAVLLRLALKAVADHARGTNGQAPPLQVRALAEGGRIRIAFSGAAATAGPDLGFARRVVELHGGALAVESESRGRSRYAISL